jgi:hypothetical protein
VPPQPVCVARSGRKRMVPIATNVGEPSLLIFTASFLR